MNSALSSRLLAAALAATSAMDAQSAPAAPDLAPVGAAINALGLDLWGKLAAGNGNLAFSPASIAMALAMTTAGARGATQQELLRFLHVDDPGLLPAFGVLGRTLEQSAQVKLAIANRLFGDKGVPFEAAFLELLAKGFGSALEPLDIRGQPEAARLHVNAWVAEHTADKIRDILPPRSVDQDTRFLLANAVHFLGDWLRPFSAPMTQPRVFHLADGTEAEVPTMDQTAGLEFAEVDGSEVVQLRYKGRDFAMLLVLPPKAATPASWASKAVLGLSAHPASERVHLQLPRFKVEAPSTIALKEVMQALGVQRAFSDTEADLTGIAHPANPNERLKISEVWHKAFVRVDEKGTEAAAATVVAGARGAAMPPKPPREVRFDRPFWFALRHLPSGAVLFTGKVMDPR